VRKIPFAAVLLGLGLVIGVHGQETIGEFSRLILGGVAGAGTVDIRTGTGSPESVVTGDKGDLFIRTDGGVATTAYFKETTSSTTGWAAVAPGTGGPGALKVQTGTGTPEGAVTGAIGDIFLRTNGSAGTSFYIKESGAGNTGWVPGTTPASTTTFTGKTYDAEGSGNLLTLPFTHWFTTALCQNTTPVVLWNLPTVDPAVAACNTGTNMQKGTLDFADAGNALSAQQSMMLSTGFTGAANSIDYNLYWFTSATTGNVVWQVAHRCTATGDDTDQTFIAADTVTDAAQGTTNRLNLAIVASASTTGCAAGSVITFKVTRDPAHASDTLAASARLYGIELTYRRAI
jgi:hypothetical protein